MNSVTLVKPGDKHGENVTYDFAGNGIVLEVVDAKPPLPHYFDSNRDAKEFIIHAAHDLLELGYHVYTGEPE